MKERKWKIDRHENEKDDTNNVKKPVGIQALNRRLGCPKTHRCLHWFQFLNYPVFFIPKDYVCQPWKVLNIFLVFFLASKIFAVVVRLSLSSAKLVTTQRQTFEFKNSIKVLVPTKIIIFPALKTFYFFPFPCKIWRHISFSLRLGRGLWKYIIVDYKLEEITLCPVAGTPLGRTRGRLFLWISLIPAAGGNPCCFIDLQQNIKNIVAILNDNIKYTWVAKETKLEVQYQQPYYKVKDEHFFCHF